MTPQRPASRPTLIAGLFVTALGLMTGAAEAQQVLPPTYGSGTLSTDQDDMLSVDLEAGGPISAAQVLGPPCAGMVANAPDYTVVLQGRGQAELVVSVTSQADTTLVVGLPNGRWLCNDDADGVNPAITVPGAIAAAYNIWVGTFESVGFPPAQLVVRTRTGTRPSTPPAAPPAGPTAAQPVDGGEYYYASGGSPVGPVPLSDIEAAIEAGTITPETLVWQEGMDNWQAAESVPAIDALFPVAPPPLPAGPPPLPTAEPAGPPPLPPADEATEEESAVPPEGGKGPDEEGEAVEDEAAADVSDEQLLAACRSAAEGFGLEAAQIEPTCQCVVGRLAAVDLAPDLRAAFVEDFDAASDQLRAVDQSAYDEIDNACF